MRQAPALFAVALLVTAVAAQTDTPARAAFEQMADAERAFVQVAQTKNWRLAFLEYFVDGIRGFEGEDIKEGLRRQPDPPNGLEFWWEPRYGDVAASGELGWLTGPVRRRLASVNDGQPIFGNYASIWKRQADGAFKVILDVGINTPDAAPFPPGLTRVPMPNRYTGPEKGAAATDSLRAADRRLTSELVAGGQAAAYAKSMAPFARFHRTGHMPLTERGESLAWLEKQPAWTAAETSFAEAAQSGDLGYTWGSYAIAPSGSVKPETGHYVRVWSRDVDGQWRMVLDVLQPKRPA